MNKRINTRRFIRRVIFIAFTVTAFTVQCTVIPLLDAPFPVFILIPVLTSVAMFEKEFSGFFFGVLTGALWDLGSTLPDGIMALFLSTYAFFTGLISRYLIRNTLLNNLILSILSLILYCVFSILYVPGTLSGDATENLIKTVYLPGCISALVLAVPLYFTIRAVAMKLREEAI